ncbi:MAG: hypothetical protein F9K40_19760 [Kofleriaceae bacterium]|nr:MAG: hypothetical protein F9K40_19760 [Kofleriaceae bacterium]
MSNDVKLQDVTAQNWRAVVNLRLADDQQRLLASNVYSIAQSKFDPDAHPRAICAGETVVGFLMYDVPELDDEDRTLRDGLVTLLSVHRGNVMSVAAAMGKRRSQIYKWARRLNIDLDAYRR